MLQQRMQQKVEDVVGKLSDEHYCELKALSLERDRL